MPGFSESKFSAKLQRIVSNRREESGLYSEIASHLALGDGERVLDIGTGTGLQLRAIHQIQPTAELYGLDLSGAAIEIAKGSLGNLEVDLREGSILSTAYQDDFFDIITCNASMSYWENPREGFNEIYRILKPGGRVLLFEPHRDIDIEAAMEQIRMNMADKSRLRRWGAVQLNKYGLMRGDRTGIKLYSISELKDLARSSYFGENHSINETSLLNIPIFARIHFWKPAPGNK